MSSPRLLFPSSADVWKTLPRRTLIGEPNKCIINVRNPKLINIHKRVVFSVRVFIPPQIASPKTPQPAIRTSHVFSKAILFSSEWRNPGVSLASALAIKLVPRFLSSRSRNRTIWLPFVQSSEQVCWEIHFYKPLDF